MQGHNMCVRDNACMEVIHFCVNKNLSLNALLHDSARNCSYNMYFQIRTLMTTEKEPKTFFNFKWQNIVLCTKYNNDVADCFPVKVKNPQNVSVLIVTTNKNRECNWQHPP